MFIFACSLALIFACTFALPVFAAPALAFIVGVAVAVGVAALFAVFALLVVFELSAVVQPTPKTPKANKVERARIFRKVFLLYPVRVYVFCRGMIYPAQVVWKGKWYSVGSSRGCR